MEVHFTVSSETTLIVVLFLVTARIGLLSSSALERHGYMIYGPSAQRRLFHLMGKAYTILFGQKLMTVLDCQQLCKAKTGKDLPLLFLLGWLWLHNRIE